MIYAVIIILFIHWVADFVCQTSYMAENKSKSNKALLYHTTTYCFIWFVSALFIAPDKLFIVLMEFIGITFVCHTITDYFTSRLNAKLWREKKVHWFFVSVGFDQWLHFVQLLLTYQLLIK